MSRPTPWKHVACRAVPPASRPTKQGGGALPKGAPPQNLLHTPNRTKWEKDLFGGYYDKASGDPGQS